MSFIFAFLFKNEKAKSPNWQKTEVITATKIKLKFIFFVKKYPKINITTIDKNKEPKDPEIVLFGLILVIFGPLNIFPKIYPPISDATQVNINVNIIIFNCIKLEKKNRSELKIKI